MTRYEVESSLHADGHIEYREERAFYSSYAEGYMDCFDLFQASKKVKKQAIVIVPNEYTNINQEAFNEWMTYKKYKNKGAITKTLNMLNKYDFQTQQEMVDKSIMNEYKGLFEPKQKRSRTDNNVDVAMSWIDDNVGETQCLIK